MLSTDSLVRELFLVCQLAIGYQLAKNQLASNRPIGNWCQLASNWPIGLDWQLAGRARFFWIGLAIGWPTKNYLSNWATLVRSSLPPKIRVNGQRPEITRKSLFGMKSKNSQSYATERRQPDISVSYRDERRPWKVAFHGDDLEYPKYLEKKHGKNGISMTILVEKP